jgi:uncharacterized membrane protein YtjA (UPF0391 family)
VVPIGKRNRLRDHLSRMPLLPVDSASGEVGVMNCEGATKMLYYALVFFVIALIAALFGFGGIAAGAAGIAKILFTIFVVLFLVSLVFGIARRGRP